MCTVEAGFLFVVVKQQQAEKNTLLLLLIPPCLSSKSISMYVPYKPSCDGDANKERFTSWRFHLVSYGLFNKLTAALATSWELHLF